MATVNELASKCKILPLFCLKNQRNILASCRNVLMTCIKQHSLQNITYKRLSKVCLCVIILHTNIKQLHRKKTCLLLYITQDCQKGFE